MLFRSTHYYMEYLYKYPQSAFPYQKLYTENKKRSRFEPEYEILDTGIFQNDRYFDVQVTYAKENSDDIFIRINITNRYHESAPLTLLPTLWFANKWSQGRQQYKPSIEYVHDGCVCANHKRLGEYYFYFLEAEEIWFTENETNTSRLQNQEEVFSFSKDAFHFPLIHKTNREDLTTKKTGTKCAPLYQFTIQPGETKTIYLRLTQGQKSDP